GFSPHVEHVRAFGDPALRVRNRVLGRKKATPVAEAVGGNVDDSYDDRTSERHRGTAHPPLHEGSLTAALTRGHAGATSGPPRIGGERRGSATGIGFEGAGAALVTGDAGGRGGSFSPRMSTAMSSRVSVSRSSSAAATACSNSRFSVRVVLALA